MPWAVRFRLRVAKKIASDAETLEVALGDYVGTLKPIGEAFRKASTLDLRVIGIPTEQEARDLAGRLKLAVLVHGAKTKFGIDAGEDRATSSFGQLVKDAVAAEGYSAMPDVHGITVYEAQGNEVFVSISGTASVMVDQGILVNSLQSEFADQRPIGAAERTALDLINLAALANEHLARATLAIAAVELLSRSAPWSAGQEALIQRLASDAAAATSLPNGEAVDVADALKRLFRSSIRQQVKRTLAAVGLAHRWKDFDRLYGLRSAIFHGSTSGREFHVQLANEALEICSEIVLAAVEAVRSSSALPEMS